MIVNRASFHLLLALFMLPAAGGCESGLRIGDAWVIPPKGSVPTHLQIVQYQKCAAGKKQDEQRKVVVRVSSGRTSLIDTDGRVFPSQLPDADLEKLQSAVSDQGWRFWRIGARNNAEPVHYYEAAAYDGDVRIGGSARWAVPPDQALPRTLGLLMRTFNRAYRMAHPLSEHVDLIE